MPSGGLSTIGPSSWPAINRQDMSENINLLITVPIEEEFVEDLKARFPQLEIHYRPLQKGEQPSDDLWADAEILYAFRNLPNPEQAPKLRWVQFHSAGVDAHIDHPLLAQPKEEGTQLLLTTLSGANAPQVAEHALALILALSHNVPAMLADQSRAKWSARRLERFIPHELYGATVGIVGYGSVGRQLAHLLQPFEVTVLASKRDLMDEGREAYYRVGPPAKLNEDGEPIPEPSLVRRLYPGRAMRSMFKDCNFVVVTVPLTKETHDKIGAKQLAGLKPNAFLVDVSRGGVVDHGALIAALKEGALAGAALDVFPEEPLPADSPLWEMPNVIISPHVAGLSAAYNRRAMALFAENLARHLAGEDLLNKVDLERGY
jgi:phosphoglycerate dehydrogenase-like enzyme